MLPDSTSPPRDHRTKICRRCGGIFRPHCGFFAHQIYCSRECSRTPRVNLVCDRCGSHYDVPASQARPEQAHHYCSMACSQEAQRGTRPNDPRRTRIERVCEECGGRFEAAPNLVRKGKARFCSAPCARAWFRGRPNGKKHPRVLYFCQQCGRPFEDLPRARRTYCSNSCHGVAKIQRHGALSITSIEAELYATLAAMGIVYERQRRIRCWVVDAYLPGANTIVEAMGDFYHCNPAIYRDGPTCPIQVRNAERDQRRQREFAAAGYRLILLWERDIKTVGVRRLIEEAGLVELCRN